MYVFAAKNYNEAVKRKKYLIKIAELQRKQKQIILQHQRLISNEKIQKHLLRPGSHTLGF